MRSISAFQDVSLSCGSRSRSGRVLISQPRMILDSSGEPSASILSNASMRSSHWSGLLSETGWPNRCNISSVILEPFQICVGLSRKHDWSCVNRSLGIIFPYLLIVACVTMPIGVTTVCGRRRIFSGRRGSCHPHASSLSRSVFTMALLSCADQ